MKFRAIAMDDNSTDAFERVRPARGAKPIVVEADNEDEAIELAMENFPMPHDFIWVEQL